VRALLLHEVELIDGRFEKVPGSELELPAELVLLAMGFVGPERGSWLDQLGVTFDERGNVRRDDEFMTTVPGVFTAGDMGRGQSLIVWAIAEGRACAAGVDRWLMGETSLPAPVRPDTRPLV
jgi:glutamate synthase (NADPH/NADH) small chain